MKRIITFLIIAIMAVNLLPALAFSAASEPVAIINASAPFLRYLGCDCVSDANHLYKPEKDNDAHFERCVYCDDIINSFPHDFINDCDETCEGCGFERYTVHAYEPSFDDESHFLECTVCGDMVNVRAHNFADACDTDCLCGYVREISHNYQNEFDEYCHFYYCLECGDTKEMDEHGFVNACDTDCECGFTRTITHDYKPSFSDENHFDKCTVCGDTINSNAHKFDNSCDTDCVCGYVRNITHKYDNDCDTECNECKTKRSITHKFGEYVYNNDATFSKDGTKTRTCSVCKHKETITAEGTKAEKPLVDSTKKFTDVPKGKWYTEYVDFAVTYGIFKGTADKTFSPDQQMTRAQFVQVFANLAGVDTSNGNINSGFTDVPSGKWYTAAIAWASKNNIVSGVGNGKFNPEGKVTRQEMCIMIVNFIEKYQKKTLENKVSAKTFADDKDISSWAKAEVYKCAKAGLISGVGDNKFDPKSSATRAQGARIFTEIYKNYIV